MSYVERRVFPGGCFFAATALEMSTRPGPVKDRVAAINSGFTALLSSFAATALEQHELPAREDPDRLAFELHAILLGADAKSVLNDDPAVLDLARQVIRQRLGLETATPAKADAAGPGPRSLPAAACGLGPGRQACPQMTPDGRGPSRPARAAATDPHGGRAGMSHNPSCR